VADVYTAFILHLISSETPVPVAGKDEFIRVFYPKTFIESANRRGLKNMSDQFEESGITMDEIIGNPSRHLMVFRPSMLDSDFDGNIPNETVCLYSTWTGYLDRPDWKRTKETIEAASGKVIEAHTSGHILSRDIIRFVKSISPNAVVPVHTFEPDRFQQHFDNAIQLTDGEPWQVE